MFQLRNKQSRTKREKMFDSKNKQLMVVIYDGISNSVFVSQVLQPLLNQLSKTKNLEITLVSFEQKRPPVDVLMDIIPAFDKFHLVISRKLPYISKYSMLFAVYQLKKLLKQVPCHEIIARGPLAGWVAMKTLESMSKKEPWRLREIHRDKFPKLTVQARGLCAEEYRYTYGNEKNHWLKWPWRQMIYKSFKNVEFEVYRNKRKTDFPNNIAIEAVSTALKDYLVQNFRADASKISLATKDLVPSCDKKQVSEWRAQVRTELSIPDDTVVYCYSGSYKPWQCANESINYFIEQYKQNSKSFMLVLSRDKADFVHDLTEQKIPENAYAVLSVKHQDLFKYLSAADHGLMFRKKDVINWVSRPTKMLEYQSVGLNIIHNNTIAWLVK